MSKANTAPEHSARTESADTANTKSRKKKTKITPAQRGEGGEEGPVNKHWRTYFLAALIETSNVKASAERATISPSRAYKVRREDPAFAAAWRAALCEGYENLEMELLGYLRNPAPEHKMDVANAIRLLERHRATVAQQRALDDNRSEQEVLDSIDAMIDGMRTRAAANEAVLAQIEAEADHAEE